MPPFQQAWFAEPTRPDNCSTRFDVTPNQPSATQVEALRRPQEWTQVTVPRGPGSLDPRGDRTIYISYVHSDRLTGIILLIVMIALLKSIKVSQSLNFHFHAVCVLQLYMTGSHRRQSYKNSFRLLSPRRLNKASRGLTHRYTRNERINNMFIEFCRFHTPGFWMANIKLFWNLLCNATRHP